MSWLVGRGGGKGRENEERETDILETMGNGKKVTHLSVGSSMVKSCTDASPITFICSALLAIDRRMSVTF